MTSEQQQIIDRTVAYVQQELAHAEGGHDWFHIYRVWKQALHIAQAEQANVFVVSLAALLHDIADAKFHHNDDTIGPAKAQAFLLTQDIAQDIVHHVVAIVENISFKGGKTQRSFHSKELDVVQDADRLDAIGAIGIARTFHYGGYKHRAIYDPSIPPNLEMDVTQYRNSQAPTLNHFYEKLLLLKDRMNTDSGKVLAAARHQFMEEYLHRFYKEWEGEA
ncbi:uncharacterized protein GA0116948_105199 [Chitinophaga costaii]|uniref:HD/PDEase domain-containing protein n=2 Tax=Chitinophaga costaii TaxID=1335309 RepID=A0A1C4DCD2_9BACT|nr:HD domain-containing protein [Chitinophaga costaii]SCC29025.1 uncharacterized protein GA0116948_105199 [Chitinophaga costaii]